VIGVAADVHNNGLANQADPEYYVLRKKIDDPNAGRDAGMMSRAVHFYDGQASVIVRSAARPDITANWIRSKLAQMDSTTPVAITTMNSRLRNLSERPRFSATLLSAFAIVGLLLAAFGLYGLVSFLVVQCTGEIGLRMAVGATPAQIMRLVLAQAFHWTAGGLLIGLGGSMLIARSLRSMLFEVQPENPILFIGSAFTLLVIAFAATTLPSLRAARVDPTVALRQE
jgi:putative ABC transport system permease protein